MAKIHNKQISSHIIGGQFAGGNLYLVKANGVSIVVSPGQEAPLNTSPLNQINEIQSTNNITGGTFNGSVLTLVRDNGEQITIDGTAPSLVLPNLDGQSIFDEQSEGSIVGGKIDGSVITLYKLGGETIVINGYSDVPSYPENPGFVVTTTTTTTAAPTTTTTTTAAPTTTTTTTEAPAPTTTTTTTLGGGFDSSLPSYPTRNVIYDSVGQSYSLPGKTYTETVDMVNTYYPLYSSQYLTTGVVSKRVSGTLGLGARVFFYNGNPDILVDNHLIYENFWVPMYNEIVSVVYSFDTDNNGYITRFESITIDKANVVEPTAEVFHALGDVSTTQGSFTLGGVPNNGALHSDLSLMLSRDGFSTTGLQAYGTEPYRLSTTTPQVGSVLFNNSNPPLPVPYNYKWIAGIDFSVPRYMTLKQTPGSYFTNVNGTWVLDLGEYVAKLEWDGNYVVITELIAVPSPLVCDPNVTMSVLGSAGPGNLSASLAFMPRVVQAFGGSSSFDTLNLTKTFACTLDAFDNTTNIGSTNWFGYSDGLYSSNTSLTYSSGLPQVGDVVYRDMNGNNYFPENHGFIYQGFEPANLSLGTQKPGFRWVSVGANGVITSVELMTDL